MVSVIMDKEKIRIIKNSPCQLCGGSMGGKAARKLSYGGICCLSCRAFFRRAHQKTKNPEYRCHSNGNCQLDVTSRSHCPKCWLDVCLKSEMKSDLVLTEKQRRLKYPSKKNPRKRSLSRLKLSLTRDANSEKQRAYLASQLKSQKIRLPPKYNSNHDTRRALETTPTITMSKYNGYYNFQNPLKRNVNCEAPLLSMLKHVLMDNILYIEAKSVSSLQTVKSFIDPDDWEALLEQNVKLFVNYILGQYLSSKNPIAKMMWIKTDNSSLSTELQYLAFSENEDAKKELCLFQQDYVMQKAYEGFAEMLRKLPIGPKHKEDVAEIILFYTGHLPLKKQVETNNHFQQVIHQFCSNYKVTLQTEDMLDMFSALEAMTGLFDQSSLVKEGLLKCSRLCGPNDHQLIMGYTFEEGMWLGRLQETVMSKTVSMQNHPEVITELIDYAFFGSPLKPDFYKKTGRLFWERIWKVYLSYPEFIALSAADKTVLFLNSFKTVYAVQCVMLDGQSIEKIASIIFSDKDREDNVYLQYMCNQSNLMGVHKIPILRTPTIQDVYPHLPPEWAVRCRNVSSIFREEKEDTSIFLYLTVSAMFDGIPVQAYQMARWNAISSLRQFHLLNLARRFCADYENMINHVLCEFRVLSKRVDLYDWPLPTDNLKIMYGTNLNAQKLNLINC